MTQATAEQSDILIKAAELHLTRVNTLQGVEWKVTFSCWTLMIALFAGAISSLSGIAGLIKANPWLVWTAYLGISAVFLFVFCPLNFKSLVTERNRYQIFQDKVVSLVKLGTMTITDANLDNPDLSTVSAFGVFKSGIWWFKCVFTVFIASGASYALITTANLHP